MVSQRVVANLSEGIEDTCISSAAIPTPSSETVIVTLSASDLPATAMRPPYCLKRTALDHNLSGPGATAEHRQTTRTCPKATCFTNFCFFSSAKAAANRTASPTGSARSPNGKSFIVFENPIIVNARRIEPYAPLSISSKILSYIVE